MLSPNGWKKPFPGLFYALDNGAFPAFSKNLPWDEIAWRRLLDRAHKHPAPPAWSIVPDAVGNRQLTLEYWHRYSPDLIAAGFPLAFAAQDGMSTHDVPANAEILFIGGSTRWKWRTFRLWADAFPRVHVGRVRQSKLLLCSHAKIESCDGTGWFREGQSGKPRRFLEAFLSKAISYHPELSFGNTF